MTSIIMIGHALSKYLYCGNLCYLAARRDERRAGERAVRGPAPAHVTLDR